MKKDKQADPQKMIPSEQAEVGPILAAYCVGDLLRQERTYFRGGKAPFWICKC